MIWSLSLKFFNHYSGIIAYGVTQTFWYGLRSIDAVSEDFIEPDQIIDIAPAHGSALKPVNLLN